MNQITTYLVSLILTLLVSACVTLLLRTALRRVLADLCGTEERANFWTIFSMIMLIAMPVVIGMGYTPEAANSGYLFALAIIGGFVSFFALLAPRPRAGEGK